MYHHLLYTLPLLSPDGNLILVLYSAVCIKGGSIFLSRIVVFSIIGCDGMCTPMMELEYRPRMGNECSGLSPYFVEASELFLAPTFSRIEPASLKIELTQAADTDRGLALSWLYPPDQH